MEISAPKHILSVFFPQGSHFQHLGELIPSTHTPLFLKITAGTLLIPHPTSYRSHFCWAILFRFRTHYAF